MGFFDLSIPYHESDRHIIDKSSLKGRRLMLTLKAMELGYTGVAYNRTLKSVMSESDRCSTPFFPISKLTPSTSSFLAAVKFHRELLNIDISFPFRQYTRLTVIVDIPSHVSALNTGNPILKSYDIVAVRPMNQNAFDQACQTSEVDIIAIEFGDKLPFRLKQPMIKAAIKRGVYFEITYSGFLADAQSKRQIISNCKLLVDWTRGRNLIFSSAASCATELRGPQDVTNLFSLLGLPIECAKAAISKNCRSLLANALRKKHFYKEVVKVEVINPKKSSLDGFSAWDPISSGDGDLWLDDMEKSFAISNTIAETATTETVKTVNFVSDVNGLPVHGLHIKDLIDSTKAASDPSDSSPPENHKKSLCKLSTEMTCDDDYTNSNAIETAIFDNHNPLKLSNSVNKCGVADVESVPVQEDDAVPNNIDSEKKQGTSNASSPNVCLEGEQYSEMTCSLVKPIEGLLNMTRDFDEPISDDVSGIPVQMDASVADYEVLGKSRTAKVRRKRNMPHQPFLFPSRRLPFKRKSRK